MSFVVRVFAVVAGAAMLNSAYAYETDTHRLITWNAAPQSKLADRLNDLGFASFDSQIPAQTNAYRFLGFINCDEGSLGLSRNLSIRTLLEFGAFCEDAFFEDGSWKTRFMNHFYDPIQGGQGLHSIFGNGESSFTWGSLPSPNAIQKYSYFDALEYLHDALTSESKLESDRNFALAFRSVGHFVHLVQDVGQPQHTRNDPHPVVALYEGWVKNNFDAFEENLNSYSPTLVQISKLEDLWHTAGLKGLSDFSNSNFVSEGTNFVGGPTSFQSDPDYPNPSAATATVVVVPLATIESDCPADFPPGLHGSQRFVRTPVIDRITNQTDFNNYTATFPIWAYEPAAYPAPLRFDRINACAAAGYLLPRVNAFSIAALDYMFRGELEVSPPDSGVYAVIDHSTTNAEANLLTYSGFPTIRVKVRNESPIPPGESEREAMGPGTLHARLKFRRNTCYWNDLRGQPGTPEFTASCIFAMDDFVVSDPISLGVTTDDQDVTFTFSNRQLPLNATNVLLQVIYRGPLGDDADAVVVKSVDLSEPSFLTIFNATDYIHIDNQVHTRIDIQNSQILLGSIEPSSCVETINELLSLKDTCFQPSVVNREYTFGSDPLPSVVLSSLPVRRFVRFAYLSDGFPIDSFFRAPLVQAHSSGSGDVSDFSIRPTLVTSGVDPQSGLPIIIASPSTITLRGVNVSSSVAWVLDGGRDQPPVPASNLITMNPLSPAEKVPMQVQINQP